MPTYTVDEFDGDAPIGTHGTFDNLRDAKTFARELFANRPFPNLKGDIKGGLHIDVYRADTGTCFLTLPGRRRK